MKEQKEKTGVFRKVAECLYRYSSNDVYYARFKSGGKEIRCSLETTDRKLAERNLAAKKAEQSQIDRSQGKLTLAELCDRYLKTVRHQKPKTVERKTAIIKRVKTHWPEGKLIQVGKIKPSDADVWLSGYRFGETSRELYISCLRELFDLAVRDRVIATSPVSHLRYKKRAKPIRRTPTFEQFQAIVESIRSQKFNGHDADESADFVEFIGLAGLGQAEASALTYDDIDWQKEQIITFRHKTSEGFAVPLFPQLRPLLEKRYAQREEGVDRVFKIDNAKKAITAACRRLKLPAFSHRSFRRMFITRAIERGIDVKVIAEWQGHRDGGKLILQTYSHVNPAHSNRMAQLLTFDQPVNVISLSGAA